MTPRRGLRLAAAAAVAVVLAALASSLLLQPRQVARLALDGLGDALGLELAFDGAARYRLRGTPLLEVHGVSARLPGGGAELLRAERALVSLPWSTIRERAAPLVIERIELDAPVLDLGVLQDWRASRPPGGGHLPTLSRGIGIRDGHVAGDGWTLDALDLDLPTLADDQPLSGHARGRLLLAPPTVVGFDLALAATRPSSGAGVAARGRVQVEGRDWRLPATVAASGPLHLDGGVLRVRPLKLGMSAAYVGDGEPLRFTLGAHGPLRLRDGTWTLVPASLALDGEGIVPRLDARGRLAFGPALLIEVDGTLPAWPATWPALPPPLSDSRAPLPVAIAYAGARDASGPFDVRLRRDAAWAEGRARIAGLLAWQARAEGSPLPPLQLRAGAPRVDIAAAVLEGVELSIEPDVP